MKLKHEGFSANRLHPKASNPREVLFARAWAHENAMTDVLRHLVPDCQPRDAQVAATVVQWLGSNVGVSFLQEIFKAKIIRDAVTAPPALPLGGQAALDAARAPFVELVQLREEVKALRKGAERYRKLRDGSGWPAVFSRHDAPEPLRGADLDAAVGAA